MQLAAAFLVCSTCVISHEKPHYLHLIMIPPRSSSFSHISSGYLYHSTSHSRVRVDATYSASIVSSLLDYTDRSADNLVRNTLYTIEPSVSAAPKIWTGFVKPAWALFEEDILVKSNAVFSGVVNDKWSGAVASVSLSFRS